MHRRVVLNNSIFPNNEVVSCLSNLFVEKPKHHEKLGFTVFRLPAKYWNSSKFMSDHDTETDATDEN